VSKLSSDILTDETGKSEKEFIFTDADFQYLSQLAYDSAGINLREDKKELIYGRLSKRIRILGMTSFKQYCDLLRSQQEDEIVNFINAITTNVTHFFREIHHFEYLETTLLPEIMQRESTTLQPVLRVWSAGCSSGNEPYSIAMVLKECIANLERWDAKILATDLDSNILEVARNGVYPASSIESVSERRVKNWFKKGAGNNEGEVKISRELIELVSYKKLNLMGPWPMKGLFDFIFCRNVAIYFDKMTREKVVNRLADQLKDGGCLFVGHSETLFGITTRFECVGKTIYRKIS